MSRRRSCLTPAASRGTLTGDVHDPASWTLQSDVGRTESRLTNFGPVSHREAMIHVRLSGRSPNNPGAASHRWRRAAIAGRLSA